MVPYHKNKEKGRAVKPGFRDSGCRVSTPTHVVFARLRIILPWLSPYALQIPTHF